MYRNLGVTKGCLGMKVIIDLDESILSIVQKLADEDDRSRKQMLELIIKRSLN